MVELLGSDLGNPGQCLVLLTLPLRLLSIFIWGLQPLPSLVSLVVGVEDKYSRDSGALQT